MNTQLEKIYNFVINDNLDVLQKNIDKIKITKYSAIILNIKNNNFVISELPMLIELFRQKQLVVIGIRAVPSEALKDFAQFSNLAIFSQKKSTPITKKEIIKNQQIPLTLPSIIRGDIEENKQEYAKKTSLILIHNLNKNAEAISDESITIYGGAYGKIFAGIKNPKAFIYTSYFQAQLICISGIYKKFDTVPNNLFNKTVVISLELGKLNFKVW